MSTGLAADEVYCRDCGEIINERAEICPECGIRQREPGRSPGTEKNPGLAAVASFLIPGLGQVYNGQITKGIIAGAATILFAITIVGLIVAVPMWVWLIYDAYTVAERGGASPSSGDSGGPIAVRTTIESALTWKINHTEDSSRTEELRSQFRKSGLMDLHEEVRRDILGVVDEYAEAHDRNIVQPIREKLGL